MSNAAVACPLRRRFGRRERGVSLIETAVAATIGALLLTSVAPGLRGVLDRQRLDGVAGRLAADLRQARAEAIARNQALRLSIHATAAGSCWIVHSGTRDQCSCTAAGSAACSGDAKALKTAALTAEDRVAVQGNVGSLLFDPLHGTVTPSGTLRLVGANGQAVHHVVNVMGRVRSCSPAGAVPALPGYPTC